MALWLAAGALVGVLNAFNRWWTVARTHHDREDRAVSMVLGGMMVRLLVVAALLIAALRVGIVPGLLAFGGMWLARWGALIWIHRNGVYRLGASRMEDE